MVYNRNNANEVSKVVDLLSKRIEEMEKALKALSETIDKTPTDNGGENNPEGEERKTE